MINDKYDKLFRRLKHTMGESCIVTDKARLFAYGTSAGFYSAAPRLVVQVNSENDIREVMAACKQYDISLTFRGSGTSVSGQSLSDSVLVLIQDGWKKCEVTNDGESISLGVQTTGGEANDALRPFGRKIGPDPASIKIATIAGIVSNNSSGPTCGTALNAWTTIEGIRILLADGTVLDTRDETSRQRFLNTHAIFVEKLLELACKAKENSEVRQRILKKYSIKNTIGYSVNSLVSYDDPFDIIMHLMVGSEGTLAFISEVTLKTVEDLPEKATSLMAFENAEIACEALLILKQHRVAAAEFMDRRTIAAIEDLSGIPPFLRELGPNAVTLLVETRAQTREQLQLQTQAIIQALDQLPKPVPISFCFEVAECNRLWEIRGGFDAIIKAKGAPGTVMVGEDVAIPIEMLGSALKDFRQLFERWGYDEAIIMGHALSGNCHFTLLQDFNSPENVERFKGFVEDLVNIVVEKYDGSLKAEHGTGRCMAPFVEKEWGKAIFSIMKEIKSLFDPAGILNRGVIFTENLNAHISYLKRYAFVDPIVDACVECGYCERECVSHGLTLSARQRVALIRYVAWLRKSGEDQNLLTNLEKNLSYLLVDTCAACGRCAAMCPSGISIGNYVKKLRAGKLRPASKYIGNQLADRIGAITSIARSSLAIVAKFKVLNNYMRTRIKYLRNFHGTKSFRLFSKLPLPGKCLSFDNDPLSSIDKGEVVYFPSCINRIMGASTKTPNQEDIIQIVHRLCNRAGYKVRYCDSTESLCCGLAFASKGHKDAAQKCEERLADALLKISGGGKIPILCEMSSCLLHMKETLPKLLRLYEPVEFAMSYLVPHLNFKKSSETIVVHPVCSTKNMGLQNMLVELAAMCAEKVVCTKTSCCGFAGDKGFTHPELNRHGLRHLAEQLPIDAKRGFSTNRTCEIGLSEESGIPFTSILYLVEERTRSECSIFRAG
ncbi:MAG: FAD-binding oxidoreductase [Deltaproteobacteria bacterium]|nr:FAD-binding oxidoreductase [Deltaproteobacteria bacterium]